MRLSVMLCLLFAGSCLATPGLAQTITTFAGGARAIDGAQAVTQSIDAPHGVLSDGAGGYYFSASGEGSRLYHVDADGNLHLIAGGSRPGFAGDGGQSASAQLNSPEDVVVGPDGSIFFADTGNMRIRKITPDGVIKTVAGNGDSLSSGSDGGPAVSVPIYRPEHIAVDGAGNLFIADWFGCRIRKVSVSGTMTTVAGNGVCASVGDGGPAKSAQVGHVEAIAVDQSGNLFFGDGSRIRRIAANGFISTFAGGSQSGFSGDGGPATVARLTSVNGLAIETSGNLLFIDYLRIRKIMPNGVINTVAGTGMSGFSGDGGSALSATLTFPSAISVDMAGNVLIADTGASRIRKITTNGTISTVAGTYPGDGGPATSTRVFPRGLAFDAADNLLIADVARIRKITKAGIISEVAGSTIAASGTGPGNGDGGPASAARFSEPAGIAIDASGNTFVLDCAGPVRKINADGIISTIYQSSGQFFVSNFCRYFLDYDGILKVFSGIAADSEGNLFIAETGRHRILKITPAGVVSTFAGTGTPGFSGDGGAATSANLMSPSGLALDKSGNLFIADSENGRIRKVNSAGFISTYVDTNATMGSVAALVIDRVGNLYFSTLIRDWDTFEYSSLIRKVTPDGNISTVAGVGRPGSNGDGGPAIAAELSLVTGLALDSAGNLFLADELAGRVRRIGLVSTVPSLVSISPLLAGQGATVNVRLVGTSFESPLAIDAGTDLTVTNVTLVSDSQVIATFTTTSSTLVGTRSVTVTTSGGTSNAMDFAIVPPFPDVEITSTHSGNVGVGFKATYVVGITNQGGLVTSGPLTVTDILPSGMTFVSATGDGWSCSASGSLATCSNPAQFAPGAASTLMFVVDVGSDVAGQVTHSPMVTVAGDLIAINNTASERMTVATPNLTLGIASDFSAGEQSWVGLRLPSAFPNDVTGTLKLAFLPDAVHPADDPAIQFATGGREVPFTILANSLEARFGSDVQPRPIAFQPGTVAGALTFSGVLRTGSVETPFSQTRTIPAQVPTIKRIDTDTRNGFVAVITLFSTPREVSELSLQFETQPPVRLSCESASLCKVSGSSLVFDAKALFDAWFSGDSTNGSLSTLRVPLSIQGKIKGTVRARFRNSRGLSEAVPFSLP